MNGKIFNYILNIIYPPKCVFCRRLLPISTQLPICEDCMNSLPFCLANERCEVCGKPVLNRGRCDACAEIPRRGFFKAAAAYVYKDAVKDALIRFKSENYSVYAKVFATHMCAVAEHDFKNVVFDAVISVPPRVERIKSGEYDQARCLASELAKQMGILYNTDVLRQIERRKKQSDLSAGERAENVRKNFRVENKAAVSGKILLLVDDINTTGATLDECSKTLKAAGAHKVYCLTAATVP